MAKNITVIKRILYIWIPILVVVILLSIGFQSKKLIGSITQSFSLSFTVVENIVWYPVEALNHSVKFLVNFGHLIYMGTQNEQLVSTLRELQAQNQTLAIQNKQLQAQLQYMPQTKFTAITARVVGIRGTAFQSRLFINRGLKDGIRINQAVLFHGNFIGRIYGVSDNAAAILLITDSKSVIPVTIKESLTNVLMKGNNTPIPSLKLFQYENVTISEGDHIFTSGINHLIPKGLPIGIATKTKSNNTWKIKPYVSLFQIDYITILLNQTKSTG